MCEILLVGGVCVSACGEKGANECLACCHNTSVFQFSNNMHCPFKGMFVFYQSLFGFSCERLISKNDLFVTCLLCFISVNPSTYFLSVYKRKLKIGEMQCCFIDYVKFNNLFKNEQNTHNYALK